MEVFENEAKDEDLAVDVRLTNVCYPLGSAGKMIDVGTSSTGVPLITLRDGEKSIDLTYSRVKLLLFFLDPASDALLAVRNGRPVKFRRHLGGNVYLSVADFQCVNIRKWKHPSPGLDAEDKELTPTGEGISLRNSERNGFEWGQLKDAINSLMTLLPQLQSETPCYDDHQGQLSFLCCGECSPNTYQAFLTDY